VSRRISQKAEQVAPDDVSADAEVEEVCLLKRCVSVAAVTHGRNIELFGDRAVLRRL